jgi:hypothetical protein
MTALFAYLGDVKRSENSGVGGNEMAQWLGRET